ncbi:DUF11 domain-containing protein [Kribbella sp. NBC_01505]|uniref:DUF11 domain-containing protein n=1 Tax=Kribbella sp. NBC_01505 TaxID=2903580 RepID=UPI00386FA884
MRATNLFRAALVTIVAGATLIAPATAMAEDPPTSTVTASQTQLQPGTVFTVHQTLFNKADFTLEGAKGALYSKDSILLDRVTLVSCTGNCYEYDGHVRASFGDLPAGASREVTYTLKVIDNPVVGPWILRTQLVGDNYSFDITSGPDMVIGSAPAQAADVAVGLTGSVSGSRITYTVSVKNNGPADATGINVAAAYPSGLTYVGTNGCTRVGTTRNLNCAVASLASGATTTKTFTASVGLLATGSFVATAQRTASSPNDPAAANDKASRTCSALLGLMVRC